MATDTSSGLAAKCLDLVGEELDQRQHRIVVEMCQKVSSGEEIPPQLALQKWLEMAAVERLRKGLKARARQGD